MEQLRFLMLIGLAGAGKSTFANEMMEDRDDIVYLSSDLIREELTGDINNQNINTDVFKQMEIRTKEALKEGKHVIYDATNINRKKRIGILKQLPKGIQKIAVYMSTDYETVIHQNENRERKVPQEVIDRMYKNMQIPTYTEGWHKIMFVFDEHTLMYEIPDPVALNLNLAVELGREGYEIIMFLASYFEEFTKIYDMPQDSSYHSFSVSRHTYYVYKYVLDNYQGEDKMLMLWTALLHDIGKAFCKSFKNRHGEETRHANFIGHDNVGSQIAINFLKRMNFQDDFIHNVAILIQYHMYLLDSNANPQKLLEKVGEDLFKKLEFLREADTNAH